MRSACSYAHPSPALLPNMRVIPPQPFAPSGKGRLARVPQRSPIARLASAASASRSGPFRAGASACGGGIPRGWRWRVRAFLGRPRLPPRLASGLGRPPHPPDAGHPASAEYRLRGLSSPRRRGWPSGRPRAARPRVRPRSALRAISPCVSVFYDAAARRLHLPCRPASVRIVCGIKALVLAGEGEDFIRTVIS